MTAATKTDTDAQLYDKLLAKLASAEKVGDNIEVVAQAALDGQDPVTVARELHGEDTSRSLLVKGLNAAIASVVTRIAERVAAERGEERVPRLRELPDSADALVAALHAQVDLNVEARAASEERIEAGHRYSRVVEKVNRSKLEFTKSRPEGMDRADRQRSFDPAHWLDLDELRIWREGNPRFGGTR